MVKLATELLSELIQPVRIVSISDEGGIPQGEFVSNQQRFQFRFTKAGRIEYGPKNAAAAGREDSNRKDPLLARLREMKATIADR